ncbi:MAG: hypothetical protein N3E45_01535 [Oscillatoriaceae bacterium SKW80]|nr:hypothetical protein [Oscillatoriaceae bacterium SKYG93]MCX8119511.1 hypothetical protein [Oscillatoriaceae bacterium SKW80]MDW8454978.1 hypothetical protein [Oscillatoriaceae cyanobacterium SKYGB_i_bin93]HIK28243.1 hypothetical protein [Oscillatoriaceae cyanobacterium M7585_C2015_266]
MFRQSLKIAVGFAVLASAGIVSGALAPSASAFIFTARSGVPEKQDINQYFTISFDGKLKGQTITRLTSEATSRFWEYSQNRVGTHFDINERKLAALSFAIFPSTLLNDSLPNQARQQKTGVDSDRSSQIAQTHPSTTDYVNKVALSNFGISYQQIKSKGSSNLKNTGKIIVPQISEKKAIPEPGTVSALFLMALAISHYYSKRQIPLHKS